jgi:ferredoxin-NADP reductase
VTLLAAGIGITPLYAMALRLEAEGVPFTLHYYLKNRAGAFVRELQRRFRAESVVIHSSCERQRPAAFSRRAEQDAYRISDLSLRARGIYGRRARSPWNGLGGNADP